MTGIVTHIQRNAIHDGPGIRTTVFLKGCNLQCYWCHNPKTIDPSPELQFLQSKCIGCGQCAKACPSGAISFAEGKAAYCKDACLLCWKCLDLCAAKGIVRAGETMSAGEVLREVQRDRAFYDASGGGVTFSGGEPLLQREFLKELLVASRRLGLHTAVDTAGNVPWQWLAGILPLTDLFLFDIKCMDVAAHRRAVGAPNDLLLANLDTLSEHGAEIWIRVPVIPGLNATTQEMESIAGYIRGKKGISGVELVPYHRLAQHKYDSLGRPNGSMDLEPPTAELMDRLNAVFRDVF